MNSKETAMSNIETESGKSYQVGETPFYPVSDEEGWSVGWVTGDDGKYRTYSLFANGRETYDTKEEAALVLAEAAEKIGEN
jgi:beta-lactamase class D